MGTKKGLDLGFLFYSFENGTTLTVSFIWKFSISTVPWGTQS